MDYTSSKLTVQNNIARDSLLHNNDLLKYNKVVIVLKNSLANAGNVRHRFDHWIGKISWKTAWQPTPAFLPGDSHGQRSLVGFSPQGGKESDTTEMT